MNSSTSEPEKSDDKTDSQLMMRFGKRQVQHWRAYLALVVTTALLFALISTLGITFRVSTDSAATPEKILKKPVLVVKTHVETDNLISNLKLYGLWQIHPSKEVPRYLINSYPPDLNILDDVSLKKRVFLHSLLPHALFVRQEALYKRNRLESILGKIKCSLKDIDFDLDFTGQCSWSDFLAEEEVSFIQKLCKNYRTTSASGLLERVDAVPTSIILAQGALESSWGSSRFTREGNSIFGMWTWKQKGMIPSQREEGKTHKVKAYESILDSVRAYHLTLNRLDPYDQFRQLRRLTDDPLILADGLYLYSERGEEYVEDIKRVILSNDLQKYDSCRLSDQDLPEFSSPVKRTIAVSEPDKASL